MKPTKLVRQRAWKMGKKTQEILTTHCSLHGKKLRNYFLQHLTCHDTVNDYCHAAVQQEQEF